MLALLGTSYYQSGRLEQARKYSLEAVDDFSRLQGVLKATVAAPFRMAQDTLALSEGWIKEPIQVEPREIVLQTDASATQPVIRRVKVRTFRVAPLTASSDNAAVKARVLAGDEWGDANRKTAGEAEKEIIVEIAPETLKKAARATITVSSATLSGKEAKVSLLVNAK